MPVPKKNIQSRPVTPPKMVNRPGPAPDEQEEGQGQSAPQSRADAFNNMQPEAGINLPPGQYTAHLVDASKEIDGQKEAVKITYEIYDGEHQGETVPAWYNLFDKEGNSQRGIGFIKRDFGLLGQPELDYDNLEEQLQNLANERPLCNLTVKKNGQWTNIYLQGLAEGA